jgi:hypothetical protein
MNTILALTQLSPEGQLLLESIAAKIPEKRASEITALFVRVTEAIDHFASLPQSQMIIKARTISLWNLIKTTIAEHFLSEGTPYTSLLTLLVDEKKNPVEKAQECQKWLQNPEHHVAIESLKQQLLNALHLPEGMKEHLMQTPLAKIVATTVGPVENVASWFALPQTAHINKEKSETVDTTNNPLRLLEANVTEATKESSLFPDFIDLVTQYVVPLTEALIYENGDIEKLPHHFRATLAAQEELVLSHLDMDYKKLLALATATPQLKKIKLDTVTCNQSPYFEAAAISYFFRKRERAVEIENSPCIIIESMSTEQWFFELMDSAHLFDLSEEQMWNFYVKMHAEEHEKGANPHEKEYRSKRENEILTSISEKMSHFYRK